MSVLSQLSALLQNSIGEKLHLQRLLFPLAQKLWPELKDMSGQRQLVGTGEVLAFLYSAPLALFGLAWLAGVTDLGVARESWAMLASLAVLMFIFRKLGFFMISEIRSGRYASLDGSMESMILWTAILLFGPTALWLAVFWSVIDFAWKWDAHSATIDRWTRARNFSLYLAATNLGALSALAFYARIGGRIPIPGLEPRAVLSAFAAMLVFFLAQVLIWLGFILYAIWIQKTLTDSRSVQPVVRFLLIALALPNLSHPFGALLAGSYSQNGPVTFSFFMVGMTLVAFMARRLSWAMETNRQRSRQLEKLEMLSRAILAAPPDASALPAILEEFVPSMFPSGKVAIWIEPDEALSKHPGDWPLDTGKIWQWLKDQNTSNSYLRKERLPWDEENEDHNALVVAPINDVESDRPIGGVYLELFSLAQPWDDRSLANLFPAVQSLAAQVASALHQARVYVQALAYQKVTQELRLAGRIQASFLPDEMPRLTGWQLAVTLLPARETSGDFFDLIPLSNGKLGILIADVTDKGVGAALYMALTRTLIRTYAIEFDDDPQPEVIFFAANNRILNDARAELFVTAFYGILDPGTGELTYVNAGHNPPFILPGAQGEAIRSLGQTGMPIGVEEDTIWTQGAVQINMGDILLLYTDGIPDSQNEQGDFFGDRLLVSAALSSASRTADEIQERVLEEVQDFVEGGPQFDDITLMILVRDG